jgi:pilus assembly protein CpaF
MSPDVELIESVRARMVASEGGALSDQVEAAVRASGRLLDAESLAELRRGILAELDGLGSLQPVLDDPGVTDLLINSATEIYADAGSGLVRLPHRLRDESAVRDLAVRLAARAGRRLDDASPFVDARLPGGARLHAILPPLATRGTTISIRVPAGRVLSLDDLIRVGSIDEAGASWLRAMIRSRTAFLISGGTGSGKTTVLAALLGLIPTDERILVVEDTAELRPVHPHVIGLEGRPANSEGKGEVSLRTLVRQALRMRPDRLIVGEVRGEEVIDLLAALNTGHEGGAGTIHANSELDVPSRVESLALGAGMSLDGIRAHFGAAIRMVVHMARRSDGLRVVSGIGLVVRGSGSVQVSTALLRDGDHLQPTASAGPLAALLGGQISGRALCMA